MQPQIKLPDRKTLLCDIITDVMPAIKPIEIPIVSKQAWSPASTYPAATQPRDKPPWIRKVTHAATMRIIWVIFEITLFCIILAKILLQVAYH